MHRHQFHLVDGDVLEVDGDGGLRVEEDVGVDVSGQRLGQLNKLLLERAGAIVIKLFTTVIYEFSQ